jgi:hypothetical protein
MRDLNLEIVLLGDKLLFRLLELRLFNSDNHCQ